jgi:hypothetical protein
MTKHAGTSPQADRGYRLAVDATSSQISTMPNHRFKVGQKVVTPSGGSDAQIPRGPLTIVRLLPLVGGDPQYRVVSTVDGLKRALLESQIRLLEETPAAVTAPPVRQGPGGNKVLGRRLPLRRHGMRW